MGTVIGLVLGIAVLVAAAFGCGVFWGKRSDRTHDDAVKSPARRSLARTTGVEPLDIHPLSSGEHDRFAEQWSSTQASFVDSPGGAVSAAETLVEDVMRARGYPVGDFDLRAADISVEHPRFVERYLEARDLALANQRGTARTEDLARATVHYRALFDELLERS